MNAYAGFALDIIVLALLAATIYHARRLSKQFEQTQADRKAFEQLISALNLAASRAESAIRTLREAASISGEELQETVNKARAMSEELEIMVQAGDNLAERLNKAAEAGRRPADGKHAAEAPAAEPHKTPTGTQPRTRAEKELLDALKAKQQP